MDIRFRDTNVETVKTDLLILPVQEKRLEEPAIRALDRRLKGGLRERIQKSKFSGVEGSTLLYSTAGALPARQLLLLGWETRPTLILGEKRERGAARRR